MISAIIVAAGRGTRMGAGKNKIFMDLNGKNVIEYTLSAFCTSAVDEIVIAASPEEVSGIRDIAHKFSNSIKITAGGASRQQSVFNALKMAGGDIVCIHDGARCLITAEQINKSIKDCEKYGAAALGVKCKDTMKLADENGYIQSTIDRESLYMIQTPQVFYREKLLEYHKRAERDGIFVTDDCSLFELYGDKIYISEGSYENIKLTTPEDIITAAEILKRRTANA